MGDRLSSFSPKAIIQFLAGQVEEHTRHFRLKFGVEASPYYDHARIPLFGYCSDAGSVIERQAFRFLSKAEKAKQHLKFCNGYSHAFQVIHPQKPNRFAFLREEL